MWDIDRDIEIESVEVQSADLPYLLGRKSPLGYVVTPDNETISLDRGTLLTLYNVSLEDIPRTRVHFAMNSTEEFFVLGSRVHVRYNLAQIIYAHGLRRGEERIALMEKAYYQLSGGRTTLHDFALNLPLLQQVLNLYEQLD